MLYARSADYFHVILAIISRESRCTRFASEEFRGLMFFYFYLVSMDTMIGGDSGNDWIWQWLMRKSELGIVGNWRIITNDRVPPVVHIEARSFAQSTTLIRDIHVARALRPISSFKF